MNKLAIPGQSIVLGNPNWLIPVACLTLCLLGLITWSYFGSRLNRRLRFVAAILKSIAIVLIAASLLQPMVRRTQVEPRANLFSVLVDNSRSMNVHEQAEWINKTMSDEATWKTELERLFDVKPYRFDERLSDLHASNELGFDGQESNLQGALQSITERFASRPVAGMLLMTDGNYTDERVDKQSLSDQAIAYPIYPVVVDQDEAIKDLSLSNLNVTQTDFEAAPVTITTTAKAVGMIGSEALIRLVDPSGSEVARQKWEITEENQSFPVRFQFRPKQSGVQFYRVQMESDEDDSEWTYENNQRTVVVDRKSGPFRILYVAGRPNWEFKFLRRALQSDAEVELVGLLRIANKEPKFSFRAKGGGDTNPLFAGLGEEDEEARQQYDQPVMIRLGVADGEELGEGFPEVAEELFGYHALILDDLEADFFTQDQMRLIRRFVNIRGGGLLMLGGQESFDRKNFARSILGELAPIYAGNDFSEEAAVGRFELSREGLLEPWMRLRPDVNSENQRLASMPEFRTIHQVRDLKPGAIKLGNISLNNGQSSPALIAQRFGRGRTAAMMIGDLWRWSMKTADTKQDDPAQAWRQITRWLVGEVPRRVELSITRNDQAGTSVDVTVRVSDEAFNPLENADVFLTVSSPGEKPLKIRAEPHTQEIGVYQTSLRSRSSIEHQVTAEVTAADGEPIATTTGGWVCERLRSEFEQLAVNREFLSQLAQKSGGRIISVDELPNFVDGLRRQEAPVMQTNLTPIWHQPWWMIIAMGCLITEWGLRRQKGLA